MHFWSGSFASAIVAALFVSGTPALVGKGARDEQKDRAEADALFTNNSVLHLRIRVSGTNVAALRQQPHKYVSATVREGEKVYTNVTVHLKGSA